MTSIRKANKTHLNAILLSLPYRKIKHRNEKGSGKPTGIQSLNFVTRSGQALATQ
jgi:hypothetical protein